MILKSGFLLIELMVALTLFIFFLSAICSLQVLSIKNRDFATKRMIALNELISEVEGAKTKESGFLEDQKIIIEYLPEIRPVKNEKNSLVGKNKVLQLKRFSSQKEILGKKVCTVCLVAV